MRILRTDFLIHPLTEANEAKAQQDYVRTHAKELTSISAEKAPEDKAAIETHLTKISDPNILRLIQQHPLLEKYPTVRDLITERISNIQQKITADDDLGHGYAGALDAYMGEHADAKLTPPSDHVVNAAGESVLSLDAKLKRS